MTSQLSQPSASISTRLVGSTGAIPKRSAQCLRRAKSVRGTRSGETSVHCMIGPLVITWPPRRGALTMLQAGQDQRQYPRFGLGLPVTLVFGERRQKIQGELQDISRGGCFFKSRVVVDLERRISVVLCDAAGRTFRASGRVIRTVAYKG